jgi:hypothetical protein
VKEIGLKQRIFEIGEAELRRVFGLGEEWTLTDTKIVEKAKDPRRRERFVLGVRFTHKDVDTREISLDAIREEVAPWEPTKQT